MRKVLFYVSFISAKIFRVLFIDILCMSFVRRHISNWTRRSLLMRYQSLFVKNGFSFFYAIINLVVVTVVSSMFTCGILIMVSGFFQVVLLEYLHVDFLVSYLFSTDAHQEIVSRTVKIDFEKAAAAVKKVIAKSDMVAAVTSYKLFLAKLVIGVTITSIIWAIRTYIVASIHEETVTSVMQNRLVLARKRKLREAFETVYFKQANEDAIESFKEKGLSQLDVPVAFEASVFRRMDTVYMPKAITQTEAFFTRIDGHLKECQLVYGSKLVLGRAFRNQPKPIREACDQMATTINRSIDEHLSSLTGLKFLVWKLEMAITASLEGISNIYPNPQSLNYPFIRECINFALFCVTGVVITTSVHTSFNLVFYHVPLVDLTGQHGGVSTALASTDTYLSLAKDFTYTTICGWYSTTMSFVLYPFSNSCMVHDYLESIKISSKCAPSGTDLAPIVATLEKDSALMSKSYSEVVDTIAKEKTASLKRIK